ncbi:MAG: TIGR04282 family arsenosugar biosynthesis glycosyltransferase [Sphingomonadales bacterium]|nr:TIGR04282 family arsenosugar biosynthesis glycosyltransferase [Sphingomonadales bacterium]
MSRNTLILFVKSPVFGRVKTRLARDIGWPQATTLYRRLTGRLLRSVAVDRRWRTALAVTPDHAVSAGFWPRRMRRIAQGGGDLGSRMRRALLGASGPAVIVGSDIPGIDRRHIATAFQFLRSHDVVIGPALDGGYWLIGVRCPAYARRLFYDVRWSSAHALADTLTGLPASARVANLPVLRDIDDAADLSAISAR